MSKITDGLPKPKSFCDTKKGPAVISPAYVSAAQPPQAYDTQDMQASTDYSRERMGEGRGGHTHIFNASTLTIRYKSLRGWSWGGKGGGGEVPVILISCCSHRKSTSRSYNSARTMLRHAMCYDHLIEAAYIHVQNIATRVSIAVKLDRRGYNRCHGLAMGIRTTQGKWGGTYANWCRWFRSKHLAPRGT